MASIYYENIPDSLINALEYARLNNIRIRILYGDPILNKIWQHEEYGYIHKTAGDKPQPILINNNGKFSHPQQLYQDCIMQIEYANKKDGGILYEYKP